MLGAALLAWSFVAVFCGEICAEAGCGAAISTAAANIQSPNLRKMCMILVATSIEHFAGREKREL
jgi:hypothetical protein